ncbi:hypothetical protein [Luteococcus sp. OSA5]|uniref:hypothetical protein n=1 Tax=Luteococcus sp. OSA5 TaxID=3401630 RepID=UPI003B42F796
MASKQNTLRFEMPFGVADPVLVKPELGLARAVRRQAPTRAVTLLDTHDHRLLRSGVVLAHRVSGELGEWYLDAPDWQPWLPSKRREPLGASGDLPDELAGLVRPFRRRAPLGPAAALNQQRIRWSLLDADGNELARLRDQQTTVRRAGTATARYRQVTVRCDALDADQRTFVADAFAASGGTRVEEFPGLRERIGAPATGLTDFRAPRELGAKESLEGFAGWIFANRLNSLMRTDLGLRSGLDDDMDLLREQLAELLDEVRSLAFALEPEWREQLEQELQTLLAQMANHTIHQLGDEYFDVIDSLVLAARAPKLGNQSNERARRAVRDQVIKLARIMFDRAQALTPDCPDARWEATLTAARQLSVLAHTGQLLFAKRARKMERALARVVEMLQASQMPPGVAQPRLDMNWDVATAFQEGRRYERRRAQCLAARQVFVEAWPDSERRLRQLKEAP